MLTSINRMGDIANVLKNAVEAASMSGLLRRSNRKAFHNRLRNHFIDFRTFFIGSYSQKNAAEQNDSYAERSAFKNLAGVIFRIYFFDHFFDNPFFVDDERNTSGPHVLSSVH